MRHYHCIIDTGSAAPIAVKQIRYDQRDIPIMEQSIAALKKMGQILPNPQWSMAFQSPLCPQAPSGTHQRHQGLCLVLLHQLYPSESVTCLIAYLISCCNNAVENTFKGFWMWLYDVIMGYCTQISGETCFPGA